MIFTETSLQGVFLVDLEPVRDERGMFMRTWCQREFEVHGLRSHGYSQAFGEYTERHPAWASLG